MSPPSEERQDIGSGNQDYKDETCPGDSDDVHTRIDTPRNMYICIETHLTHIDENSCAYSNCIRNNTQLKILSFSEKQQMSFLQWALHMKSFILSLYFILSFLYLSTTSLSLSLSYLQATYQSQDVVGAISVSLWQDQSFEEILNNSSDDML